LQCEWRLATTRGALTFGHWNREFVRLCFNFFFLSQVQLFCENFGSIVALRKLSPAGVTHFVASALEPAIPPPVEVCFFAEGILARVTKLFAPF
jgi:hypothetical protein